MKGFLLRQARAERYLLVLIRLHRVMDGCVMIKQKISMSRHIKPTHLFLDGKRFPFVVTCNKCWDFRVSVLATPVPDRTCS